MLNVIWQWLKSCWKTRPRWEKCAMCQRRIWVYGEPAPAVCSESCREMFLYSTGEWIKF